MTNESETMGWAEPPKEKKTSKLLMVMYVIAIILALILAKWMGLI